MLWGIRVKQALLVVLVLLWVPVSELAVDAGFRAIAAVYPILLAFSGWMVATAKCPVCGKPYYKDESAPGRRNALATSCLNCKAKV